MVYTVVIIFIVAAHNDMPVGWFWMIFSLMVKFYLWTLKAGVNRALILSQPGYRAENQQIVRSPSFKEGKCTTKKVFFQGKWRFSKLLTPFPPHPMSYLRQGTHLWVISGSQAHLIWGFLFQRRHSNQACTQWGCKPVWD